MKKILILCLMLVLTLTLATGCDTEAGPDENYPTRSIDVVVGWGAGGGTDVAARTITRYASETLGVSMPVRNLEGGSGLIAGDNVVSQPADGYTMWAMGSNYVVNVALGRTPHDLDAYIPVARLQHDTAALHVNINGQFSTIDELVDYAKANPGDVTIGGTGAASFDEVVIATFLKEAEIEVTYVPYESGGTMQAALLGGHIDVMFEEFGPAKAMLEEGSIKPVVVFSDDRLDAYPDLPTAQEKGWNVSNGIWRGFLVKAGTPDHIVQSLRDALKESYDNPEYKEFEEGNFLHLREGWQDGEDFRKLMEEEIEQFRVILESLGHI